MPKYTIFIQVEADSERQALKKARKDDAQVYGPGRFPMTPAGTECLIAYEGENFSKGVVNGWFSANHYTHAQHIPFKFKPQKGALFITAVPTPPPPLKPDDPFHWKLSCHA